MEHRDQKDLFNISFKDKLLGVKGSAEIAMLEEDDQIVYLAKNILFDNTLEELLESGLVVEPELRLKTIIDDKTDGNNHPDRAGH